MRTRCECAWERQSALAAAETVWLSVAHWRIPRQIDAASFRSVRAARASADRPWRRENYTRSEKQPENCDESSANGLVLCRRLRTPAHGFDYKGTRRRAVKWALRCLHKGHCMSIDRRHLIAIESHRRA